MTVGCSMQRITVMMDSFSLEKRQGMVEDDGKLRLTCEDCSRVYELAGPAAS